MSFVCGKAWRLVRATVAGLTILVFFQLSLSAPARAQNTSNVPATQMSLADIQRNWSGLTPFQQLTAVDQMISAGAVDQAEALLSKSQYSNVNDQITQRFQIARIAQARGQNDQAIAIYRDILVQHPQFSRVRMALATALFQTQDDEAARHHLELVLGDTASNPNLANTVRSYINAIDGRRLWDASAYVTLAPSTNFNQGSDSAVIYAAGPDGKPLPFTLNKANRKQSGIGVAAGANGSYRQPITDQLDFIISGGVHTKTFRDGDFNDALFYQSAGPRLRFEWGYLGLYGLAEQRFYANDYYFNSYGGLLSATVRLGPQDMVFGDFTCSHRSYDDDWKGSDLSYQSGHSCSVSGRVEHAFDSTTLLRVLGSVGRDRTGLKHLDNESWSAGAGFGWEMPWGISLYAQALYTSRDFDGVFAGSTADRSDDRWDFSINMTKRDWVVFGFAPQLQYTYTTNDSNVNYFNFDAHGVNLTLTKRF